LTAEWPRSKPYGSCEGVVAVKGQSLFKWLALVAVVAIAGLLVVFLSMGTKQRGDLVLELGKGLILSRSKIRLGR
jgi:hypothetical protein